MSINDRQLAFLRGQGYTGSINDAYRAYLLAQLGVTTGSIDDLLYSYLKGRWGYTGNLNDMLFAHLRYLGYTGNLSDMLRAAWGAAGIAGFSFSANLTTSLRPEYAGGSSAPTYTRATTATFTDHENIVRPVLSGEARFQGARRVANQLVGPEDLVVNASWARTSVTVTAGISDPLGGTSAFSVAATSANATVLQTVGTSANQTQVSSIWMRRRTGSGTINLADAKLGAYSITVTLTTAWQRFATPAATNASAGGLAFRIVTSGDVIDVWHPQCENVTGQSNQAPAEYVSVGVLSTPFHGAGVDGVKYFSTTNGNSVASNVVTEASGSTISASTLLGYLAEGARTNLCLQSNAFTTTWVPTGGASPTQNQTGPDGATSAWTITGTGSNYCEQAITLTAATYTASIYVKKTTSATNFPVLECFASPLAGLCTIDTNNGVATIWTAKTGGWTIVTSSATCKSFGVNYWRVDLTFLATAASWTIRIMPCGATSATQSTGVPLGGTGSNVYYGAQVELGSFASTYIPTTTASVTRNADVLTYPFAGNASASVGSAYLEGTFLTTIPSVTTIVALAFSATPSYPIYHHNNNVNAAFDGTNLTLGSAWSTPTTRKIASSWGGSVVTVANNGSTNAGVFDGDMGSTSIAVGADAAGTAPLFGCIKNVRIYQTQLSASQLQAVTA